MSGGIGDNEVVFFSGVNDAELLEEHADNGLDRIFFVPDLVGISEEWA